MIGKLVTEVFLFLALINPISKIFILHILAKELKDKDLKKVVLKSSFFALLLLVAFAFGGTFILNRIFHISIESLQVAGGIVLVIIGLNALRKGVFFEVDMDKKLTDLAIVPIASPIIAGPATITASIVQSSVHGSFFVSGAMIIALGINSIIMYFAPRITSFLNKFNLGGALIRITGLFVASIGMNMILTGIGTFFGLI